MKTIEPPKPPNPPSPPVVPMALPVNISVDKTKKPKRTPYSLYRDLFGDDLSPVYMALSSTWIDRELMVLCQQLVEGVKSINKLSTNEWRLLDSLALQLNYEPVEKPVEQSPKQEEQDKSKASEDTPPNEPLDYTDFAGAYG